MKLNTLQASFLLSLIISCGSKEEVLSDPPHSPPTGGGGNSITLLYDQSGGFFGPEINYFAYIAPKPIFNGIPLDFDNTLRILNHSDSPLQITDIKVLKKTHYAQETLDLGMDPDAYSFSIPSSKSFTISPSSFYDFNIHLNVANNSWSRPSSCRLGGIASENGDIYGFYYAHIEVADISIEIADEDIPDYQATLYFQGCS